MPERTIKLRNEYDGRNSRRLWAYVDAEGLHIDGQDLGPGTEPVSDDREYEWFTTVATGDIPRVIELLGGEPNENVLDVLERWVGKSYELEARLRDSEIPRKLSAL